MALPGGLSSKVKNIPMQPVAIANDLQLAYMLSFAAHPPTFQSIYCSPRDTYHSPISTYPYVDFQPETYQKLYEDTRKNYKKKNQSMVQGIRCGFKEFYMRVASTTYAACLKHSKSGCKSPITQTITAVSKEENQFKIQSMRGNIASKWPQNMMEFHKQLSTLPWNAFANNSPILYTEYIESVQKAILQLSNKIKKSQSPQRATLIQYFITECQILLAFCLRTNDQVFILKNIRFISDLQANFSKQQQVGVCQKLDNYVFEYFRLIPQKQVEQFHRPENLWNLDAFMIMKKIHFQKQPGLAYFSVATDGKYLYIYISAINGGMFKVGTGYDGSVTGKVYLQRQMYSPVGTAKLDEVNWVYFKGKLYLKTSSKSPNVIQIINPQTFNSQGSITLYCPPLFGHSSLMNINKNSILLTDGESLFFLGKKLKIQKGDQSIVSQPAQPQQAKSEDNDPKKKKKKQPKKKNNQQNNPPQANDDSHNNINRVLQIVLYRFNIQEPEKIDENNDDIDQDMLKQLFDAFSGYFTRSECIRALDITDYDLQSACQWLVDEGEKQRSNLIYSSVSQIVLVEAQITNEFNQKSIKGSNQIITKDTSVLHIQNVNQSIWTMDGEQITCYSQNGARVFSMDPDDRKEGSDRCKLGNTLLQTFTNLKINRNPNFTITYDPYNSVFYTFSWPSQGGHHFPTSILVAQDKKACLKLNIQRRSSVTHDKAKTLKQVGLSILLQLAIFDGEKYTEDYRINHWLWQYGHKILAINTQMANPDVDKKKLSNKRTKLLMKLNRVNEILKISQRQKAELEKNGCTFTQIAKVFPFGADGSLDNLKLLKSFFEDNAKANISGYLLVLENWVANCPNYLTIEKIQYLQKLGLQLMKLKSGCSPSISSRINQLLINNFFLFFPRCESQMKFIFSLNGKELNQFTVKQYLAQKRQKHSVIYEINNVADVIGKFDSKTQFNKIFNSKATLQLKHRDQVDSIGNFLLDTIIPTQRQKKLGVTSANLENSERKEQFIDLIQKKFSQGQVNIKFIEFIFIQSFRLIVVGKNSKEYLPSLNNLFCNTFKLLSKILFKSTIQKCISLSETLSLILQVYYASLASLAPSPELIKYLLQVVSCFYKENLVSGSDLELSQFEGISQTSQKIYQTVHPIGRGKNQSFPARVFQDASLIFLEFDKRCQSDQNHDIMTIQTTHQDIPVGNSINCNDGTFYTNLRMSGKIDTKKPYMIFGNSLNVDFTSSGHANNAQSFNQYGFKFGVRPIYAGKIKNQSMKVSEKQANFGNKSNFDKYVNSLKQLIVVASNAIQNIINSNINQKEESVKKYLTGKIFREGFQDAFLNSQVNNPKDSLQIIDSYFKNQGFKGSASKKILQKLHQSQNQWLSTYQVQPISIHVNKQLWNFDGIPNYIRSYLEQIKAFKGAFIDVFKSARQQHAKQKGRYALELRKNSFTPQYKDLWMQGQAILFLTVLKHSGLLHLNLKFSIQYIKENLKAFQQARNGIFNSFISRMQTVREWRDLIDTYWARQQQQKPIQQVEIKQESKTVSRDFKVGKGRKLKNVKIIQDQRPPTNTIKKVQMKKVQKAKDQFKPNEQGIRTRLTENYIIEQICNLKQIPFVSGATYENVTKIIQKIKQEKQASTQSVYKEPIQHLIKGCLFLLKIRSPSTQESLQDNSILVPNEISRSLSQDNPVNTNKVNQFRQWLQNWRKWRGFKKQSKIQLQFPVTEIVDFINSWMPVQDFENIMRERIKRQQRRVQFYQFITQLLKTTGGSFLSKYTLGLSSVHLPNSYNYELQSVPQVKIKQLDEAFKEYDSIVKEIQTQIFSKLPCQLQQFQNIIKDSPGNLKKIIKHCAVHLYLASSQCTNRKLEIALYFIPFKFLSNQNEEITHLASIITQIIFLSEHSLDEILANLQKQIGCDSLSAKRWKDLFFIERILFLLRKLQRHTKKKVQMKYKKRIAEMLFYLTYHAQVPLISRCSLRIIKQLKIDLSSGLKTPFDFSYVLVNLNEGEQIKKLNTFKIQNKNSFNNVELLYNKYNQMLTNQTDPIKKKLENIEIQEQKDEKKFYLTLHLHNQEDIIWLVRVLFYLKEIQKPADCIPLTWAQYQAAKTKKKQEVKQAKKQQQKQLLKQQLLQQQLKIQQATSGLQNKQTETKQTKLQRLFANIPEKITTIEKDLEKSLPIAWFFNYCNVFSRFIDNKKIDKKVKLMNPTANTTSNNPKARKNQQNPLNNTKFKPWNTPLLVKLLKKFDELNGKGNQEPKQQDTEQAKNQFLKAKKFISRVRSACYKVQEIVNEFIKYGYYIFKEDISREKAEIISQLITFGGEGRLKPITGQFKQQMANKLSTNVGDQPTSTKMKISIIQSENFVQFENLFNLGINSIYLDNKTLFYTELNTKEYCLDDVRYLPYEQLPKLDEATEPELQVGKQYVDSSLCAMKRQFQQVHLQQYPNVKYFISQGGIQSGLKKAILVPNSDVSLTCETVDFQLIKNPPKNNQTTQLPEQLIEKIIQKIQTKLPVIQNQQQIIPYILISSYLKKLSTMDLSFVQKPLLQKLGKNLFEFSKNLKSNRPLKSYIQDIQKLQKKLLQKNHENLNIIQFYKLEEAPNKNVEKYLNQIAKNNSITISNEPKSQSQQTHQYPKSSYLLNSQLPQIQENKLLQYWEKNILPRIMEFVRTSLRPFEIQDYFEQMRIDLRSGKQFDVKQKAYVICDNKLPAGAVLPDSTHNWNALTIEEVTVGMYALLKTSKNKVEASTPLLACFNQQYRLIQVIFIELKSNSVLIRYRLEQYSIFTYMWVNVNDLMAVQKPIPAYSKSNILKQLETNFNGLIYGYIKLCLTQLMTVAELKPDQLIKQTIIDMFLQNPISGWMASHKYKWPMREYFESMIKNNNTTIIDELESNFNPIKSYQTDLYNEKLQALNRFTNVSGLIISFKKTAKLSITSGIKFSNDEYGLNQIYHLNTAKSQRNNFPPIKFDQPNVYCKYYTNKQYIGINQRALYNPVPIEVTVFGVQSTWNVACFLSKVLSEIAVENLNYVDLLARLNKLFINWILKKQVALLCQQLSKLCIRLTQCIIHICLQKKQKIQFQTLGINKQICNNLVVWIKSLGEKQQQQTVPLYSTLLQNLSELVAFILFKIPKHDINLPQHVKETINMIGLIQTIQENMKGNLSEVVQNPSPQWQRFLVIDNVPEYISTQNFRKAMKNIFQQRKAKILTPKYDIIRQGDQAAILVDGWDVNQLVQEDVIQKMQQQQQKQPQPQLPMQWQCSVCTLLNPMTLRTCGICQAPMTTAPPKQQQIQKVQSTNVNEASKKLREKQAKRFEDVKKDIEQFFKSQWKKQCAKREEQNKQLQNKLKSKDAFKKKKEDPTKNVPKQIPQEPTIIINTGSQTHVYAIIETFLKQRFDKLPEKIRNLAGNEVSSYIQKFKLLLKNGFDLWGDQTYNEKPVLLPFRILDYLMRYVQNEICKGSSSVLSYSEQSIRIISQIPLLDQNQQQPPINYNSENNVGVKIKYKILAEQKSYNIRHSWKIIKELNVCASKCLQYINMNLRYEEDRKQILGDPLGMKIKYFRPLIMGAVKLQLQKKILLKTSVLLEDQAPKIVLERLRIKEHKAKGKSLTIKDKDDYLFTRAHDQLHKISPALLRPFKPRGAQPYLSFLVSFKGELVMGEAGPYRQFFTDISHQLDPDQIGLFIKTPNNKHRVGESRSKWLINPDTKNSYHLSLYQFIGLLMGCCIRTGTHLAIDLPKLFWKQLVDQQITDNDLQEVDENYCKSLQMIKNCPSAQHFQALSEISGQQINYTTTLSNQTEVQLIPNGKQIVVTYEARQEYVTRAKQVRIKQSHLQLKSIKNGLEQMIPTSYLNCLSGEQIKLMVCGRPRVDIQLLKRHTRYAGGLNQQSPRIKYFWEVVKQFEQVDKLKLIRFCWGQQRLPINSEQYERNNIRFMIKPMIKKNDANVDLALPKADTCFFNIQLPNYSSKAILKQKLLLAINLDNVSINADTNHNPDDNPLMNQTVEQFSDDEEVDF